MALLIGPVGVDLRKQPKATAQNMRFSGLSLVIDDHASSIQISASNQNKRIEALFKRIFKRIYPDNYINGVKQLMKMFSMKPEEILYNGTHLRKLSKEVYLKVAKLSKMIENNTFSNDQLVTDLQEILNEIETAYPKKKIKELKETINKGEFFNNILSDQEQEAINLVIQAITCSNIFNKSQIAEDPEYIIDNLLKVKTFTFIKGKNSSYKADSVNKRPQEEVENIAREMEEFRNLVSGKELLRVNDFLKKVNNFELLNSKK